MENAVIRLQALTITNLKNVKNGYISFHNDRKAFKSSILGLYGQNGSGKTTLIDAISLLKHVLMGSTIPEKYANYIHVDEPYAQIAADLSVDNGTGGNYRVCFSFCLRKERADDIENVTVKGVEQPKYRPVIFDEILKFSYVDDKEKNTLKALIDTKDNSLFRPQNRYNELVGCEEETRTDLLVAKKMAAQQSRSFCFSRELFNKIKAHCKVQKYIFVIETMINFGNFNLFVIENSNNGLISMDAQPLAFRYKDKNLGAVGRIMLPLNNSGWIPQEAVDVVKNTIRDMNIVLQQIVPGRKIGLVELKKEIQNEGHVVSSVQLVSYKNGREISLREESDGIKKIISILQLLIVIYNTNSVTVAIDELDSGIFEYLLGELLRIIAEKGKGQLIFTSHNLRPLETIDKGFIAFTTTNPNKRYIRLTNVKNSNNLRDFYYRDIVLGEQDEPIYDSTNNYEIALAFRRAGEVSGS